MAKDFKEFIKRASEDQEFAEEIKSKIDSISKAEERELVVKVGKELGYDFNVSDIERYYADIQELDSEELAKVSAAGTPCWHVESSWCVNHANWGCFMSNQ
jgi:predicted ribosomally synthesized peptide with nif11-like leader